MLRTGVLCCEQLTQAVLRDIEIRNPHLGAFARITGERALREAGQAQRELDSGLDRGSLHGIPYAVKDIFNVKGQPNTAGTPLLDGQVAQADAAVVSRLARAGAVLVGQTHTSPMAATILGINHARGTPRNPWKEEPYLPGGSSSGSAVAVAAGLVPYALGSDTGGSVRVPAALCGVVGFSPAAGRVDASGMWPLAPSLDSIGSLTRSAQDAAWVFAALQDAPEKVSRGVRGLRIGVCETVFFDEAQGEVKVAVLEAARVLGNLGAELCHVALPEVGSLHALIGETSLIAAEGYPLHQEIVDHPDSDWVIHWMRKAAAYSGERVARARIRYAELAARLASRTRLLDALLVPATPVVAMPVPACDHPESHAAMSALLSRNTQISKLAGWSCLSVPCGITGHGLPIGMMICVSSRKERIAFQIAGTFEAASSWTADALVPPHSFLIAP